MMNILDIRQISHLAAWDAQLAGDLVPVCRRQIFLVNESLLKLKDLGVGEGCSGFPLLLCIAFFPQLDLIWEMKHIINLFGQVVLDDDWFCVHSVQSRHPSLMTGRCPWSQVTTSQSEARIVTRLTNQRPGLLMTHHYPGLVIVSCQVKHKLIKRPAQRLLWFLWFLVSWLWMTSEQGGRLSNCIVISVMKIDRTLIELANHHQQPGWAQQKHRNTSNITPHWMSCSIWK